MHCPNCKSKGHVFKRIFIKRKDSKNRFCVYCAAEVKIVYSWKKIFWLCLIVFIGLMILNLIIILIGGPGITSGFAGGLGAAVVAIMMRRPPYVEVQLINKPKEIDHY
ncbi:MAG: hypothetical protein GX879_04765 [Bacteroidales bacterium]|nr:hypothetical protein [Bacteroidales bacterium]